ncbi:MAG TPA: DUF3014 domain-containing protein [Casimicrobiaceae bacterium]|nr:DUF3014 domain-containing protein [Casimicrobiaceae bacterium]
METPLVTATTRIEANQDQAPPYRIRSRHRRRRRWLVYGLIAVIVMLALAAGVSIVLDPRFAQRPPSTTETPSAPRASSEGPALPRHPIAEVAASQPPLDGSDSSLVGLLQALWADGAGLMALLEPRDIVRNVVATVDNLPRRASATQRSPVKLPAGAFSVARNSESIVASSGNALRYEPHVKLLDAVDTARLTQLYVRHYPLFQQAYRDLGYPNGHFNDRLVEAIDVILDTPETHGELKLAQPKVFYEFADRELEQLPTGQKLMLRMGPENARTVKAKLTELRKLVTAH